MTEPLDALELTEGKRLAVVADADGLAAVPMVRDPDGRWRRARPGDGVAEALLALLARDAGGGDAGRFTVAVVDRGEPRWASGRSESTRPTSR